MYPVLFEVAGIKVLAYPVMMVLGYVLALLSIGLLIPPRSRTAVPSFNRGQAFDLFIVMLIASLLGAKFGHVLFEAPGHRTEDGYEITGVLELLWYDPWHWIRLDEGGYVWYGGMIGALATAVFYFRSRRQLNPWLYADAFTPAIMVGAAIGRLGCFMGGCCYGKATDLPWPLGMEFRVLVQTSQEPPEWDYVMTTVHPTQLYDSTIAALLALFLLWRFRFRRFDGELIAILLMVYPIFRSLTESLRGDAERGYIGIFSTSQLISIPIFLIGLSLYVRRTQTAGPATQTLLPVKSADSADSGPPIEGGASAKAG